MGNPEPIRRYAVAEYLALEEAAESRSEYLDGEILEIAGESANHSRIGVACMSILDGLLANSPCEVFDGSLKIRIQDSNAYCYPDLSVVCGEPSFEDDKELILKNPMLIVEVLSKSTEGYDRGEKFQYYKQIDALREYVLITQKKPQVDVFYKTEVGFWRLDSFEGLDDVVELKSLGVQIKMADIYRKVRFEETN